MNNLLNETTIPNKSKGDGLSAKEVNEINSTLNKEVKVGNTMMMTIFNVNLEIEDFTRNMSLKTAISYVPHERRCPGISVKFLNTDGVYAEYVFSGEDPETQWNNTDLWSPLVVRIDGGEW